MHRIVCIYIVFPQPKWNNAYLEITYKLDGKNIAHFCFQDEELMRLRVEIFCLLKSFRGFASYGWTNVRHRHFTCVRFAEGAF